MIQLYIDGKPAIIKNGTSFKFYRENIYFTDAEDYTLDVTLPLQGCPENLAIFSAIHRPEMSAVHLIGKKYPFHFIAPPLDITGSAIVTEINEMEVKVQLLAGSSVLNFDSDDALGHDIYIDELDLGKAFDVSYQGDVYDGNGSGALSLTLNSNPGLLHQTYDNSPDKCVCFPVYSEESDTIVNQHYYWGYQYSNKHYGVRPFYFDKFSAQPYLLLVVERILKAVGYELDPNNAIAHSWMRNVFIVNGRNEYKYANILPHWTVAEFLKEVELFCGVYFTKHGSVINAIRKSEYYSNSEECVNIVDVIDEYTIEVSEEEEGSKDPRTGNVGYDFDNIDPMLQLPDEVWENAIVIEPFSSEAVMRSWIASNISDKAASLWLFSETENHKVFAYLQDTDDEWVLCEVDQAGSLIRGDKKRRDIDVSLRIVPSMMDMKPTKYGYYWKSVQTDKTIDNAFYVPVLKMNGAIDKIKENYSVNDIINPNAEKTENTSGSKPERIEVALFDGGKRSLGQFTFTKDKEDYSGQQETITDSIVIPLATGIPYVREDGVYYVELFTDTHTHRSLLLKEDCAIYDSLSVGKKIDTRVRHSFRFLDNIDLNPKAVFTIKGRKYACEKIEYTVEEAGMSPIKRGYFYELND